MTDTQQPIASGRIRGEKVRYPDGVGCCIWIPFPDDEDVGLCFDFSASDLDDMILVLMQLKTIEPKPYDDTCKAGPDQD